MPDTFEGKFIAEKYKLGSLIRNGELGDLYEARHILMDKHVSVRVMQPSLAADRANVDRFFDEARIASTINHPHIVNINDFGSDHDGNVYAVYELVEGKSLKAVIAEDGAFPAHSAVEIARQIAEGLAASHAENQIHGNLTAENVMLTGAEGINAKVLDFTSANAIERESADPADYACIAPEQCSGSPITDERGDIYSLGAILYEMFAGAPPFPGEKPGEVMLKHIEEPPAPLISFRDDLPEAVEPVILKALSKNPEMRQQTAVEFIDELNIAAIAIKESAQGAAAGSERNLWKTAFIVFAAMSALGAFLIYATSMKVTDPATALQPDANGQPVQPINPATGADEQALAAMPALTGESLANTSMAQPPGTLPGGDGYNAWGNGGAPPPGAPYIPPGGQVVTIDPATGSPFMPPDGVVLVPVPANSNTARPTPTPKPPPANANTVGAPQLTPTQPPANAAAPKPTPTPRTTRTPTRPSNRPAANRPADDDVD